jgi:hypothetical protein
MSTCVWCGLKKKLSQSAIHCGLLRMKQSNTESHLRRRNSLLWDSSLLRRTLVCADNKYFSKKGKSRFTECVALYVPL